MKYAIMSDIHCNFEVFTILVNDALQNGVTHFLFLGDYITDGYRGNEIIKIIKDLNGIAVLGNREKYIKNYHDMNKDFNLRINRKSLGYNSLSKETLEYIRTLKEIEIINTNNNKIFMIHEINDDFDKLINTYDFDICLYGHTHIQKNEKYKGKLFINPGSIGIPYDNNGFSYSILEFKDNDTPKVVNRNIKINKELLNNIKSDYINTKYFAENPEWYKLIINAISISRDIVSEFMTSLKGEIKEAHLTSKEYNKIFREKLNSFLK